MLHITKLMFFVLLLALASFANAQSDNIPATPFKKSYERTQTLPNGIAFGSTLRILQALTDRGYRADAVQMLVDNLELAPYTHLHISTTS